MGTCQVCLADGMTCRQCLGERMEERAMGTNERPSKAQLFMARAETAEAVAAGLAKQAHDAERQRDENALLVEAAEGKLAAETARFAAAIGDLRDQRDAARTQLAEERLESSAWRAKARDKGDCARTIAAERDAVLAQLAEVREAARRYLALPVAPAVQTLKASAELAKSRADRAEALAAALSASPSAALARVRAAALREAATYVEQGTWMRDGREVAHGDPDEYFTRTGAVAGLRTEAERIEREAGAREDGGR